MNCKKCGGCCKRAIVEVFWYDLIREPRLKAVVELFKEDDISDFCGLLSCGEAKPCAFHKNNKCEIYPTRPNVCSV